MTARAWTQGIVVFLIASWLLVGASDAYSQHLFLNGGAHIVGTNVQSQLAGTNTVVQGGFQYHHSEIFRIRAAVAPQDPLSVEGVVQLHVLGDEHELNPYILSGYGYYFSSGDEIGVVPLGAGVEYGLSDNVALSVELNGRFSVHEVGEGVNYDLRIMSGLMPSVGVTYKLDRVERPGSDGPPIGGVEPDEDRAPVEGGAPPFGTDATNRVGVRGVASPFLDPVDDYQGRSQGFGSSYKLDSLRRADPLVVRRGNPPHENPGVPAVSGEVVVSDDGTMVRLPEGSFIMGLTDEDPLEMQNAGRKRVAISEFYLDRFEVTNAEYREFLNSTEAGEDRLPDSTAWEDASIRTRWETYFYGSERQDYPVVAVSWEDAKAYCEWRGKRLPTEAEWEYGARAGKVGGIYPWAGFSPQNAQGQHLANYDPGRQGQAADGYAFTAPVGSYPPNEWGLHDVAGNVAEWVADAYAPTFSQLASMDPVHRNPDEERRVVRGGSWSSSAFEIGVGVRNEQPMDAPSARVGFRCAADVSQIEGTLQQEARSAEPPPSVQMQTNSGGGGGSP